jgi:hypothetical protein
MPLYGVFQAGSNPDLSKNLSDVQPGQSYVLLDGTEDIAAETPASVAFARGTQGSDDNGISFFASGGTPGSQVSIQAAAEDEDQFYTEVNSISLDANGNGAATDVGRAAFYRVAPTESSSPVTGIRVIAQR